MTVWIVTNPDGLVIKIYEEQDAAEAHAKRIGGLVYAVKADRL